jgi:iron complex transport system ATP-binding protein
MVIHDLDLALRYSDRLVVMERGRVRAQGAVAEVLAADAVGAAFAMDVCPHERHRSDGGVEHGYVLYPRS